MATEESPRESERSVLDLIRGLQSGSTSGASLTPGDRRRCVEHLSAEGYSAAEISEIMKVSQRTIGRDRTEIRQHNALERDPKLTAEMVGYLVQQAEQGVGRIRRVIRDSRTSPGVKIDGERACWLITKELVERLQSLGYLPTAATEIRGELTHHVQQLPGFRQMQEEVARLEVIFADKAIDQQPLLEELSVIQGEVDRGVLVERIESLQAKVPDDEADSHGSGD